MSYILGEKIATRQAFGQALLDFADQYPELVVLDAEMSNSTFTNLFAQKYPQQFIQNFIAEQNMLSVALGLSLAGKIPFCATFAAFLTRAYDQIRMSQYSYPRTNLKIMGSHCGTSIGEDGPSQMALEDLSMMRAILDSRVFYPSDAVSCKKLVEQMLKHHGISYLRATRAATPVIYEENEQFSIGGSKTLKKSEKDQITLVAAGITLFESLKAWEILTQENINCRVIDLYCVKPVDKETLLQAAKETQSLLVVEDHFLEGGLFSSVCEALAPHAYPEKGIHSLSVTKMPRSGKPEELLAYEEIDSQAIIQKVRQILT